jgi:hypothetical protein
VGLGTRPLRSNSDFGHHVHPIYSCSVGGAIEGTKNAQAYLQIFFCWEPN